MTFRAAVRSPLVIALSLTALAVLTRLPALLSPELMPDPDEALIGMMAIDRMHGGAPSLFLWGQNYGFSLIEVEIAARAFSLLSISTAVLKGSMLVPFVAGVIWLAVWMRRMHGARAAWIAGALVVLCPAWFSWSLKARGGYLTAFAFAQLALVIATWRTDRRAARAVRLALIAACAGLVSLAQVLWLLPMLAFLWLDRRDDRERLLPWRAVAGSIGAVLAPLATHTLGGTLVAWHSPDFSADVRPVETTLHLPHTLFTFFTGRFLFGHATEASIIACVTSVAWLALLAVAAAFSLATRRGTTVRSASFALIATCFASSFMSLVHLGPRYLLPVAECVALLAARAFDPAVAAAAPAALGRAVRFVASIVIALGFAYAIDDYRASQRSSIFELSAAERRSLDHVIRDLEHAGVENVYVLHGMLEWTLMFESKGRIAARYVTLRDRRPEIALAVDAARASGKRVALVGRDSDILQIRDLLRLFLEQRGFDPNRLITHDDRWYYFLDPPAPLLAEATFRMSQ